MKLIVGLGNPGEKYLRTRHNIGFMVLDHLLKDLTTLEKSVWRSDKSKSEIAKIRETILVKPQTFMNECGWSVRKLADYYHVGPADIWVVHDDLDLPLGKIKIRQGGGTAGHHGLESIVEHLGTVDFVRFRLGVGRPQGHDAWGKLNIKRREVEKYVLSDFTFGEEKKSKEVVKKANKAIRIALEKDLTEAMNRFNH